MPLAICAGTWKGRPLISPPKGQFRPTSALLRQALFDKLGQRVAKSRLLDLFAGSGAISLEALSRGATAAVAVESSRSSLRVLRGNQMRLSCQFLMEIVPKDVFGFLKSFAPIQPFDWIFADPPYDLLADGRASESLMQLTAPQLRRGGLLFLERARRFDLAFSSSDWKQNAISIYGDSCLETFERL